MWYIDAKRLVDMCVEHGILQAYPEEDAIAVFCQEGNPSEEFPEGWYLLSREDVYQDVMASEEAQQSMIAALQDIGVEFMLMQPQIERNTEKLLAATGDTIRFEERRPGEL